MLFESQTFIFATTIFAFAMITEWTNEKSQKIIKWTNVWMNDRKRKKEEEINM